MGGGLLWWVKVGGIVGGEEADCSGAGGRVVMKVGWLYTVAVEKCRQVWEIVFYGVEGGGDGWMEAGCLEESGRGPVEWCSWCCDPLVVEPQRDLGGGMGWKSVPQGWHWPALLDPPPQSLSGGVIRED